MKTTFKNKDEAISSFKKLKPSLLFLTGRTASGKTTFSNQLKEIGYEVLELDDLIGNIVIPHLNIKEAGKAFMQIYKGLDDGDLMAYFIEEVHKYIDERKDKFLVIEGAISNTGVIKKIFLGINFSFIYLYPVSLDNYKQRIERRFVFNIENDKANIPQWNNKVSKEELIEAYSKEGISSHFVQNYLDIYTQEIYEGALNRYDYFAKDIENIITVGV